MNEPRGRARPQSQLHRIAILALVITICLYLFNADGTPQEKPLPPLERIAGKMHVLVTGGAGFIGSHATLRLLEEGHTVTIIDNLSRGNAGAIQAIRKYMPSSQPRLRFVEADLGDKYKVFDVFAKAAPKIDAVIHFAAVAYVGESMAEPTRYYHNITANTVILLEAMDHFKVRNLVYSSTCATYGNAARLPITELTPTEPINPYGRSKLMAEQAVRDYAHATPEFQAGILRYFNVFGSDPQGRVGELPRADLRQHSRISGACFDAALGFIPHVKIMGTKFPTRDGTCIRDYIHVTDLVDAHVAVLPKLANPPVLYNVGTGKGVSVKQFVDACKKVTGRNITVIEQAEPRPGDYAEVWADPTKIKRELNWTAKYVDIEESMRHAWQWRQFHKSEY